MKNLLLDLVKYGFIALFSVVISACAWTPKQKPEAAPIVMLHGAGGSVAYWQSLIWLLESNGWPRERLIALQQPYPLAADSPAKEQAGRSTPAQTLAFLSAEVERVRTATGAKKIILIGRDQGADAVVAYVRQPDNAANVSHVVLTGLPDEVVSTVVAQLPNAAIAAASAPVAAASSPAAAASSPVPAASMPAPVASMPAAPASTPAPAVAVMQTLAFPATDQRDGHFDAPQFNAVWQFLTGQPPKTSTVWPQFQVDLDGTVTGMGLQPADRASPDNAFINNLPLAGARVEVFAISAETGLRLGSPVYERVANAQGRWGPFHAKGGQTYEFVVRAQGYAITHIYRSGFVRGSNLVQLRAGRIADPDLGAFGIVTLERPSGGLGATVRYAELDGQSPPPPKLLLGKASARTVKAELHVDAIERVVGRTWTAKDNHIVRLEFNY